MDNAQDRKAGDAADRGREEPEVLTDAQWAAELATMSAKVDEFLRAAQPKRKIPVRRTMRGDQAVWKDYRRWSREFGLGVFPGTPKQVAFYLADLHVTRGMKVSTVLKRFGALRRLYEIGAGSQNVTDDPQIRWMLEGMQMQ